MIQVTLKYQVKKGKRDYWVWHQTMEGMDLGVYGRQEADTLSVLSHSGGGECHSSRERSAARTRWYIDHSSSAALHHPRQHQPGHQSSNRDVLIHQLQQALLGHFNQALRGRQSLVHTVHQEADIFTPQGFFDGLAGCLVQREVSQDNDSFHSVALREGCSGVSDRGVVLRDKDDADTVPGQLLCIGFGHRLWCTWQEKRIILRNEDMSLRVWTWPQSWLSCRNDTVII